MEGWLVGLGQEGVAWRWGELCKRRWNRKEGRGNKNLKRSGKLGQDVSSLKNGGLEPPHELWNIFEHIFWSTTHEVSKLGQLIDISKDLSFQESFAQFGRLKFFQFSNLLQLLSNQLCQDFSVSFFLKRWIRNS